MTSCAQLIERYNGCAVRGDACGSGEPPTCVSMMEIFRPYSHFNETNAMAMDSFLVQSSSASTRLCPVSFVPVCEKSERSGSPCDPSEVRRVQQFCALNRSNVVRDRPPTFTSDPARSSNEDVRSLRRHLKFDDLNALIGCATGTSS